MTAKNASIRLLTLVILVMSDACLYFWRHGFHTDAALIGLMAKSILERADRPIFVWKAGYQGVLLEGYATAWIFRIFGINHITLNLFNTFCLWALYGCFYRYLRKFYDHWIAILAVLLLCISTPEFYLRAMRTQPNYTETYLFGFILFIFSYKLLSYFLLKEASTEKLQLWKWNLLPQTRISLIFFIAGLIAGFAFYTYGQIAYFFVAILLQLIFLYLREIVQTRKSFWLIWPKAYRVEGDPGLQAGGYHWPTVFNLFFLTCFIIGLICFLINKNSISIFGNQFNFYNFNIIAISAMYFVLALIIEVGLFLKHRWPQSLRRGTCFGFLGFIIGYSPELYFKYVLKEHVTVRLGVGGHLSDVIRKLSYAWLGIIEYLNIHLDTTFGFCLFLFILIALACFTYEWAAKIVKFFQFNLSLDEFLQIPTLAYLPFVGLLAFCVSSSVLSQYDIRYLLILVFYFVMALSWFIVCLIRKGRFHRIAGILFLSCLLFNNLSSLWGAIQQAQKNGFQGEAALAVLERKGIHYGYADYWLAYGINFHTLEKIILEPLALNYCPFYAELVKNQDHIAYLDFDPPKLIPSQGKLTLNGIAYQVLDIWKEKNLVLYELKRVSNERI